MPTRSADARPSRMIDRARRLGRVEREVVRHGVCDGELDQRLDVGIHGLKCRCLVHGIGGRRNAGTASDDSSEHGVEGRHVGVAKSAW